MVFGGPLDPTILGAWPLAANSDLTKWMIPVKTVKFLGGAMDLVAGWLKRSMS